MKTLSRWLLLVAVCAGAAESVWAQPGGGAPPGGGDRGPGGGGPGGGGPGRGGPGGGRGGFRGMFTAMQLLEPGSFLGASLSSGMRFGNNPAGPAVDALELTEEQRDQLSKIREELGPAIEALGEEATDDAKKAKLKEFESRAVKVLTNDQQDKWDDGKEEYATKVTEMRAQFQQGGRGGPGGGGFNRGGPGGPGGGPPGGPPRTPRLESTVIVPEGAAVVSSFNTGGPAPRGSDGVRLSFNFRYAPWTEVLKDFAERAGLTLDLNVVPPGTFSYLDNQEYTVTEALDVLNGYLLQRGYILVRRDRFLTPINIDEPIPPNMVPVVTVDELPQRGKNELVSVTIPLESVEADKVVGEIRELLGPQGKASALKNTNSINITDIGSNVRRVYGLLKHSASIDNRESAFKAIPVKHISAMEAERMVRRLFGLNPLTTTAATTPQFGGFPGGGFGGSPFGGGFGGDPRFGGGFSGRDGGRDGRSDSQQQPQPTSSSRTTGTQSPYVGKIQITADTRTNHLLVTASAAYVKLVEEAVKSFDTDTDSDGGKIVRSDNPVRLKVYSVTGADVGQVARTLSLILPGLAIVDDSRTAKLHIQGTDEEHREVEKYLKELSGDGSSSVAVIHLLKLDPVGASNTLRNLFAGEGSRAPSIEADSQGRRLMVRGTPDQVTQVRAILSQLGEPGDGGPGVESTNRGPIRTLPLNGKDPQELLPLLRQVWTASGQPPIRIVVPSKPSVIQDRKVPSKDGNPLRSALPATDRGATAPPARDADERRTQSSTATTAKQASFERLVSEEADDEAKDVKPVTPRAKEPQPLVPGTDAVEDFLKSFLTPPTSKAPVAIPTEEAMPAEAVTKSDGSGISMSIIGGELVIVSEDEKALDDFEALYESVAASIPSRTRWTVFYLRTADATETAQMLERLFPQSTVATSTQQQDGLLGSFASGFSSLGRGVMNVTGLNNTLGQQSLRIVTDTRANALFVTGPTEKIDEIEQMLQLLDASELPESLRDRLPRSIPVEYADVNEVAEVVESVFKESMQAEQPVPGQQGRGGGGGGFNPLAMMLAGGQGGGKGRGPELTLGVDARSSHIIVSCNEGLYRQIEELVQTIDQRAKEARQTVRVVPLATADPAVVSGTLSSLFSKVSVSATKSTRTSRSTTSGSGNAGSGGGGGGAPAAVNDPEIIRRMMESRNAGGNSGGSPFGGAVPPGGGGAPGGGLFGRGGTRGSR